MLKNYLKISLRILFKNKIYSLINITGLSMTLVSAIFISAYFENEINYDSYHEKKDLIYRLNLTFEQGNQIERFDITAHGIRDLLIEEFPEIEEVVRFYQMDGNVSIEGLEGKKLFKENNFYHVDKEVFQAFTHPMIQGNPVTVLDGHYKVVLSDQLAEKYFGQNEAIGKSININGKRYVVTGLIEDVPKNSHLYFDALLSAPPEHKDLQILSFDPMVYLIFKPTFNIQNFKEKLAVFDQKPEPDFKRRLIALF